MSKKQDKKIKIVGEGDNKEIVVESTKPIHKQDEYIKDNLSEAELNKRAEAIKEKANELDKILDSCESVEERNALINAKLSEMGIPQDKVKSLIADDKWTPSEIIKGVSVFVVEQEIRNLEITYPLSNLIPSQMVQNGILQNVYKDYLDADEIKGYDDVVISDYNQGIGLTAKETMQVDKHIHKGYDILDALLNDIAKTPAMFISIIADLQLNVARPIAKRQYQYRLQLIADAFVDLNKDGVDISSVEPDITFEVDDLKDLLKKILIFQAELKSPSRENTPNENWIPTGFTKDLEYACNPNELTLIAPIEKIADIKIDVKSGTFQLAEVQVQGKLEGISYKKTFEEYGKITGIKNDATEFDMFLIQNGAVIQMVMYNAIKITDTPKMKSVINSYTYLGSAINKDFRNWKIRVKMKQPTSTKNNKTK